MTASDQVTVDGVVLEVKRIAGSGTPILMLHEALGSVSLWRDFPERLAAVTTRPVIIWSRQGYGRSDPLPPQRDLDYLHKAADDVGGLLDTVAVEQAHFFGHSDGASIALIAAAKDPSRVRSLILEAPHVLVETLTFNSVAKVKADAVSSRLIERLARHHADPNDVFSRWNEIWLDPRFRCWNIEDLLADIEAPTLLIQGLQDEYGTLGQLDCIEAKLRHVRRLELDHCGHSPHRDQPDHVLAAASDFIRALD